MDILNRFLAKSAIRFALVGLSGFVVDLSLFIVLYQYLALPLMNARVLAFFCAASSNWYLNRHFTFTNNRSRQNKKQEWLRFVTSAVLSAFPNLGTFYLLTRLLPDSQVSILVSMICGILIGYCSNYQLADKWVYTSNN